MSVNDDTIVCFDRLIQDFKAVPTSNVIWSRIHCNDPILRPDGRMMVISKDIVTRFLTQSSREMRCHPQSDLQVALWVHDLELVSKNDSSNGVYLMDNDRVADSSTSTENDVCHSFIVMQASSEYEVDGIWNRRGKEQNFPKLDTSRSCPAGQTKGEYDKVTDAKLCSSLGIDV